jgi:hypothetical protein
MSSERSSCRRQPRLPNRVGWGMANIIDKLKLTGTASLAEELDSTLGACFATATPRRTRLAWPTAACRTARLSQKNSW